MSRQEIEEQYRKSTAIDQFMLRQIKNRRQKPCRDKIFSCHDNYYCNLEKLIKTLYEEVMSRQDNECRDTERQGFLS